MEQRALKQQLKTRSMILDEAEVDVINELRKVTGYGYGKIEVIVQNAGEIVMIHTTTNKLVGKQKKG